MLKPKRTFSRSGRTLHRLVHGLCLRCFVFRFMRINTQMEDPDQTPHFFPFYLLVLVLVNRDVVVSPILQRLDVVVDIRTASNDRSSGQESVFCFLKPAHAQYPL